MRTPPDLTGQVFERLTVLGRTDQQTAKREWLWRCQCSCEKQKIRLVTGAALRRGDTISCGCLRGSRPFDLQGQKFGWLTVVARNDSRWLCQCDCGSTRKVTTDSLHRGVVKSCGCQNNFGVENLIGTQFGRLTVLRRTPNSPSSAGARWMCQCSCDAKTIKDVAARSLKNGHVQSCGCWHSERVKLNAKDITGLRSGKLTALGRAPSDPKYGRSAMWFAQCDCDPQGSHIVTISANQMRKGRVGSCGCATRNNETVRSEDVRKKAHGIWLTKYDSDSQFVLNVRIKALLRSSLKRKKAVKTRGTLKALGYSLVELEARLRSTLPPGCTWDDFMKGLLHIDHVKPISTFHYQTYDDPGFKAGWALTNLQLLTAEHNLEKGARLNWKAPYET